MTKILREIASDISIQYSQKKEQKKINKIVEDEVYEAISDINKKLLGLITFIVFLSCTTDSGFSLLIVPIIIGAGMIKEDIKVKKRIEITQKYKANKNKFRDAEWWD